MIIQVCIGSACHLRGSYKVIQKLKELINEYRLEEKVVLKSAFCLGSCGMAVSVKMDDQIVSLSPDTIEDFFLEKVLGGIEE